MIVLYLLASCFSCYEAAASTVIRMPRGTYQFPIEYIPVEGNHTVNGFACIATWVRCFHHSIPPRGSGQVNIPVQGFMVMSNTEELWLNFTTPIMVSDNSTNLVHLPALPGSPSSESMEWFHTSFLIYPSSQTEDVLVLNPSNATDYAYEAQIAYTPMVVDASIVYPIHTAVRLSDSSESLTNHEFIRSRIFLNDGYVVLPSRMRHQLLPRIASMGIQTSVIPGSHRIAVHDVDPNRLNSLPSLQVIIRAQDGLLTQIALIEPIDYMRPTGVPTVYEIVFEYAENRFSLSIRLIQNLLIHFDYLNNRIGFGDPLVEL